ncbi:tetratricopeptide repeat protein [Sphingomonas lacusdianchii]|uniref:tetratricopeptide repeat protein n=1 Tax=Sphingomonas lacusdianchii TaxID=2917992 RepID=UPI001F58CE3D|nr:hypothetical protein [Sphingomonas sp. JXJ CY 53]
MRTLKLDSRIEALWSMGSREALLNAIEANPKREMSSLQQVFERMLRAEIGDLARLPFADLGDLLQLYEWQLHRLVPMPPQDQVREAHLRRARLSRFDHLVDRSFTGRESDLQVLRDYVGVVSPSAWSRVRSFFSSETRSPLFISGPGGAGKTALLGRFLIEHVEAPTSGWFPFAYVAFDSDAIDVREPFTLLVEVGGQLAAQIAHAADPQTRRSLEVALADYRDGVGRYRDARASLTHRASVHESQRGRLDSLGKQERKLCLRFARLLQVISAAAGEQQKTRAVPVLIVFDTFEEVIYRARQDLIGFWRTLAQVSREFPPLRVVIAGRAGPDAATAAAEHVSEHPLKDLTSSEAASLLVKLRVSPPERARTIARQVGGNPLTLRLAARVAQDEHEGAGLDGLETKRFGILAISPALIRGQLYRRVLEHIHDDDVRALAHPGMVLRRVTPGIIKAVLAPICRIQNAAKNAKDLFEALRREHALVRLEGDGSLRYREEVRRPVLDLLQQDMSEQVRQIHQLAVSYYFDLGSPADAPGALERAEEIYHRLMLGQGGWDLDERWLPGVESYLATAIEEVPLAQRVWLAQRMSIELPAELYALADQEEWEKLVGPRVLAMLRYGEFAQAAEWLSQRQDRTPASPLFALEARVLMGLGKYAEADALLEKALAGYPVTGDRGRSAELLWLYAQSKSQTQLDADVVSALNRLVELAATLHSPLPLVQALTELVDRIGKSDPARETDLREQLSRALQSLSREQVDLERSLVRLALVRLGSSFPRTAERLLRDVYGEFAHMARVGQIAVEEACAAAAEAFARSTATEFQKLASLSSGSAVTMVDEVEGLLQRLAGSGDLPALRLDGPALDGILTLLRAENATLSGATLAGLAESRETWESDISAEVAA